MAKRFRSLQPDRVVDTVERLERRIVERFPNANLRLVAAELVVMAREAAERAQAIGRPNIPLRLLMWLLIIGCLTLVAWFLQRVRLSEDVLKIDSFAQTVEGVIASFVWVGAAILFVFSWELRLKRRKALIAIHELRSMAHIVDMHQLTKDPERLLHPELDTLSSPQRTMTAFELTRYLAYCTEILALTGKLGALYVQDFDDADTVAAAGTIETLTVGLSQKIWQKIMILERVSGHADGQRA